MLLLFPNLLITIAELIPTKLKLFYMKIFDSECILISFVVSNCTVMKMRAYLCLEDGGGGGGGW